MLCFASCLHRENFCGRGSVGLSGVDSLISLSGCSRTALSSVCVGSLVVLGLYLLVAPLLVGSPLQWVYWYSQLPPCLICDWGRVKAKWSKTVGEYSMGPKAQTTSEQRGDPLEKYSTNHYISLN